MQSALKYVWNFENLIWIVTPGLCHWPLAKSPSIRKTVSLPKSRRPSEFSDGTKSWELRCSAWEMGIGDENLKKSMRLPWLKRRSRVQKVQNVPLGGLYILHRHGDDLQSPLMTVILIGIIPTRPQNAELGSPEAAAGSLETGIRSLEVELGSPEAAASEQVRWPWP